MVHFPALELIAKHKILKQLDLTRVGGQLRVSDVKADEGSPYDAGSDFKLPPRI